MYDEAVRDGVIGSDMMTLARRVLIRATNRVLHLVKFSSAMRKKSGKIEFLSLSRDHKKAYIAMNDQGKLRHLTLTDRT